MLVKEGFARYQLVPLSFLCTKTHYCKLWMSRSKQFDLLHWNKMSMKKIRFFQRVLSICIMLGSNLLRPSLKCSGALDGPPSKKENIKHNLSEHLDKFEGASDLP